MSVDEVEQAAKNAPNEFGVQLLGGMALVGHNEIDKAIPLLEKARDMFPEYGGDDSPYALLATVFSMEAPVASRLSIPFGTSILFIGRR